jgi:hypothetical protein
MGVVTGESIGGRGGGGGNETKFSFLQLKIEPVAKMPRLKRQNKMNCFMARSLGGLEYLRPKTIVAKARLLIENYNHRRRICNN